MTPALITMLLLPAGGNLAVPNQTELADALGELTSRQVGPASIRDISCRGFKEEPTEFACKWRQRLGKRWRRYSGYLAIDGSGWHLIDDPIQQ